MLSCVSLSRQSSTGVVDDIESFSILSHKLVRDVGHDELNCKWMAMDFLSRRIPVMKADGKSDAGDKIVSIR